MLKNPTLIAAIGSFLSMNLKPIFTLLRYAAILGNILFILWITYNGIDEGFRGTPVQVVSYISLVLLLLLNTILILRARSSADR